MNRLAFDSFRDVGEIEGNDFDRAAGEMLVLAGCAAKTLPVFEQRAVVICLEFG